MQKVIFSNKFTKEYILMVKRGKDIKKMKLVVEILANKTPLPAKYKDHKLTGNYQGSRELDLEPDWLLIYKIAGNSITLERTGTHSDLFKN